MGYVKTAILMAAMTALFMGIGYLLGGTGGALIALAVAAAMNVFSWWNSDKMLLRMHNKGFSGVCCGAWCTSFQQASIGRGSQQASTRRLPTGINREAPSMDQSGANSPGGRHRPSD